jgi:hypothetical protein
MSPFRKKGVKVMKQPAELKYLVFQPDKGGWNNFRFEYYMDAQDES